MQANFTHFRILLLYFFAFYLSHGFSQEYNDVSTASTVLENLVTKTPFEKTYLHTDKEIYYTNETIWLKLYLLNGNSHGKSTKSRVVYVTLLDASNEVVIQKRIYVDQIGTGVSIPLNTSIKPGLFKLQAFTNYMFNQTDPAIFEKQIVLLDNNSKAAQTVDLPNRNPLSTVPDRPYQSPVKIQFFLQGGRMVNGLENDIGIVIVDAHGNGVETAGKVVDDEGTIVSFIETHKFGIGKFRILPKAVKEYFLVLPDSSRVVLPEGVEKGYVLNIKKKRNALTIDVASNMQEGLEGAYIIAHLRGNIIYKQEELKKQHNNSYRLRFLTDSLPDGVAQFTLFNAKGQAVCARSVFIDNKENALAIAVQTDSSAYGPRQKVQVNLELKDHEGGLLDGSVSLAVTSAERLLPTYSNASIASWLLLNSDVQSSISNPEIFFKDNSFGKDYLLDVLMMANDSRSIRWDELVNGNQESEPKYNPEEGIFIKGKAIDFRTKKAFPKRALVKLNLLGLKGGPYQEEQTTDSLGGFSFGPYVFTDTLKAIIDVESIEKRRNGKSYKMEVVLEQDSAFKAIDPKKLNRHTVTLQTHTSSKPLSYTSLQKNFNFEPESDTIELDEATVTEKKKTRKDSIDLAFKKLSPLYKTPTRRMFPDSILGSEAMRVVDLLNRLGARTYGIFPNEELRLRRDFRGNPLFVVDGVEADMDIIVSMNTSEIEFIDILYPANAGAYINNSANGVVAVYTKGSLNLPEKRAPITLPNIKSFEVSGFSSVQDFPILDYSEPRPDHSKRDTRGTLHWQPEVKIDNALSSNDSGITFYTGDKRGSYVIKVEGITTDGRPISATTVFEVK
ncbi:hypothetical protein [Maribacter sp. 2307UL18-2]|uniref:hypothetical protein n=1 Tax=Maribacter sp. 2307UL18-2 TaxID=3386274 RepID=UPI0039BD53C0